MREGEVRWGVIRRRDYRERDRGLEGESRMGEGGLHVSATVCSLLFAPATTNPCRPRFPAGRHEIGASERRKSREVERENHSVSERGRP
uniref:Uncharacterized protein n=1 Tax=Oryza rufipogon TaxID=4529 RepID=A0A0E0N0T6_ORYRU